MTETSAKTSNVKNGLMFGGIIGLIYCLSLFIRYQMINTSIITVGIITLLFYLVVIAMLFVCGTKRRKEMGGFITMSDAFQTIFVAILLAEFIYIVFNFIYLKYVDPGYFDKVKVVMEEFFEKTIKDDAKREEMLDKFREQMDKQKTTGLTFAGLAKSYLISVCITGVFGLIAALIIRKKPAVFTQDNLTQ